MIESEVCHMPPFRCTVRGMMVAVAFAASAMGLLATHHSKLGCGHASVPLIFQVVDDRNGRPVVGAKVELLGDLAEPPTVLVMTTGDGSAGAVCEAGSTSYWGPFLRLYRTFHYGDFLRVGAVGYQSVDGMLKDFMTDPAFLTKRTAHPPILIRIKRESGSGEV